MTELTHLEAHGARVEQLDADGNAVGVDTFDRILACLDEMSSVQSALTHTLLHAKDHKVEDTELYAQDAVANLIEATACAMEARGGITGETADLYRALCGWIDRRCNRFGEELEP